MKPYRIQIYWLEKWHTLPGKFNDYESAADCADKRLQTVHWRIVDVKGKEI